MSFGPVRVPKKIFVVIIRSVRLKPSSLIAFPLHADKCIKTNFASASYSHRDLRLAAIVPLGRIEHVDAVVERDFHNFLVGAGIRREHALHSWECTLPLRDHPRRSLLR